MIIVPPRPNAKATTTAAAVSIHQHLSFFAIAVPSHVLSVTQTLPESDESIGEERTPENLSTRRFCG